jgi:hypothetical protein
VLSSRKCPYCGCAEWAGPLGGGGLKPGTLLLTQVDELGRPSPEGIEVVGFTCRDCGYLRFHNPNSPGRLAPPDLHERLRELAEQAVAGA